MIYFPFVLKSSLNSTTKTKKVKIVNKTNNKHQQEENNIKKINVDLNSSLTTKLVV